MAQDSSTTSSSVAAGEWRKVIDPPDRGELVYVIDQTLPTYRIDKASLVSTGHDIWVSEDTGHIVYPTHWRPIE